MNSFDKRRFDSAYDTLIVKGRFNERPEYYPRYRSRYWRLICEYYARFGDEPDRGVLDVGGGQLALLTQNLFGVKAAAADIGGEHFSYLEEMGVSTIRWNLCASDCPSAQKFDCVFFSEVIEHLPMPGHIVLERLRACIVPGGIILCSTPNLYRLRNVVYFALGRRVFDYFRIPTNTGLGHVIEYSCDHLRWQLTTAGFGEVTIKLCQFPHQPNALWARVLSWIGYPLFAVPRFRDNLLAVARAPLDRS